MRVSGAGQYSAYGMSGSQILASSLSSDTSLMTLGTSSGYMSSSSATSSFASSAAGNLFGTGGASGLFGTTGDPFANVGSVFGAGNLTTGQSAILINAVRAQRTSPQVKLTNLESVTLESTRAKSADYLAQDQAAKDGFGLGALLNKLA